jgi:hypothetical protein
MDTGPPIPTKFTWRGKPYIHDGSLNQGECGGCWAFALTTSLADRYAIKYKKGLIDLSVLSILSCLGGNGTQPEEGCSGGNVACAALSLQEGGADRPCGSLPNIGALPATCWPNCYVGEGYGTVSPKCVAGSGCCGGNNQDANTTFYIQKDSVKNVMMEDENGNHNIAATIQNIKRDIFNNGPVPVSIGLGEEFSAWWTDNILNGNPEKVAPYVPKTIPPSKEGHAMVLMGWGNENGIDYWEVRNSWGAPGWCKFATSDSTPVDYQCGIDSAAYSSTSPSAAQGGYTSFLPGKWPSGSSVAPAPHWSKEGGGRGGGNIGSGENGENGENGGNHKSKAWMWWIIGGAGGVALITLIIVSIILFKPMVSKRRRK